MAEEKVNQRPACDYDINPADKPIKRCGSENRPHKITYGEGVLHRPNEVVCAKHRVDVWRRDGVIGIEPINPKV